MKSTFFTRTILAVAVLFFSLLSCNGKDNPSDQLVGKWTKVFNERTVTFTIASDHKFQVEFINDEEIDVWGSYVISGTQITFQDEGGAYSSDAAGVYEFKISDARLTFTRVNDPVNGRSMLVEGTWSKAGDLE